MILSFYLELRGVGDNIHVGQIWSYDVVVPQSMTLAYVVIKEINSANSTLAGYYGTRINGTMLVYPFHGEYDPSGVTIGWIVSYRNQTDNQHATCVWTGYYEYAGGYPKHIFYMTKVIANEAYATTTTETEVFQLTT